MNRKETKVALVTGANKGIGFEFCRQLAQKGLQVILTSRDPKRGEAAVQSLINQNLPVVFHQLDVTDISTIEQTSTWLNQRFGRLDYLVNNAGILADSKRDPSDDSGASILKTKIDKIRESMEVNVYGAIRMAQAFVPLMQKNGFGRILNVSSGMGQLSEMEGRWPGYRISKVSLNAVTRILSAELSGSPVTVVSVCPGWVKTDMGGKDAELEVSEAVAHLVRTLLEDRRTGVFLRFNELIKW